MGGFEHVREIMITRWMTCKTWLFTPCRWGFHALYEFFRAVLGWLLRLVVFCVVVSLLFCSRVGLFFVIVSVN